ncbi:MAG: hypothetical protein ABSF98_21530 [Bryobacteraceae bacterium]
MTSTRALWDPNYIVPNTSFEDDSGNQVAPQLIPRMHQWVDQYYPGTRLAITEYMWHNLGGITGAIAQADILGIFGREGLDYGTLWGPPQLTDPGVFAFRIFLNYDGTGNQFGETSISATSDNPDALSIFAAQRSDMALTILVLNKTYAAITDNVSLANFTPAGTAQVWQYSPANLAAVVRQPADLTIGSNTISAAFPALSMTLFVVPASQSMMPVPQPVIKMVQNAASWLLNTPVVPGEVVAILGTSLGPSQGVSAPLGNLPTNLGGVRVLFNGFPAPMIYCSARQANVVVPYEIAANPATTSVNVQVEYQGNRSASFPMQTAAVLPGLFTSHYSGLGQAALLNWDNGVITLNGQTDPSTTPPTKAATRGDLVEIFATGGGQTNPPGVDGRMVTSILPAPVQSCSANIGGLDATVSFCGVTDGLLQVNAVVPMGVTPGDSVSIQLTIGTATSPAGVTIVVQ